jgi:hypothetical protein
MEQIAVVFRLVISVEQSPICVSPCYLNGAEVQLSYA